jgi:hypothetical protein
MNLICIPALKKHQNHIRFSLSKLLNNFSNYDILIITPNKEDYSELIKRNIKVLEDNNFTDINKEEIEEFLNPEKKYLSGWYYQQFLKYSVVYKLSSSYDVITIVDADSIILNSRLYSSDKIFLNENEYHREYFVTVKKLFPEIIMLNKSSINNFQTFTSNIFREMIDRIETDGLKWYIKILKLINNSNDLRAFSEYETYANYATFFYKIDMLPLKLFRRGDLLNIYETQSKIIKKLEYLEYDIVAFETNHDIKLKHFIFSVFLFLNYNIKVYVKNLFSKF